MTGLVHERPGRVAHTNAALAVCPRRQPDQARPVPRPGPGRRSAASHLSSIEPARTGRRPPSRRDGPAGVIGWRPSRTAVTLIPF